MIHRIQKDVNQTDIRVWDPTLDTTDLLDFAHLKINSLSEFSPKVVVIGNNSKEIISDAGNSLSGVGRFVLYVLGAIVFFALLGSNPVAAFLLLAIAIAVIRKNR